MLFTVTRSLRVSLFASMLALFACSATVPPTPGITHEGLERVENTVFDALYRKPGVDFAQFSAIGLEACSVAFRDKWLRDQNLSRVDLSSRVTQGDVDRIKAQLGESCDAHLREALLREPAHEIVEQYSAGERVLLLRPAILNLDINAPDVQGSTRTRYYTTSAGEMTLVLDLLDATTSEVLARVVDRQRDIDSGSTLRWTSSVTNRAEAERQLSRWAKRLRKALDEALAHGA